MAELNITERQAGDVVVLDMTGRITIGEGSIAPQRHSPAVEEGKTKILLNLAGVGYIDSSGIANSFQLHGDCAVASLVTSI